jgi:hypothetical protein
LKIFRGDTFYYNRVSTFKFINYDIHKKLI